VLSFEANHKEGWIGRQGLAEALDSYLANLPESSGRSRFVPVPQAKTGIKPGNGKRETQPGNVMPERFSARSGSLYTDSQGQRPVPAPRPVPRRCYLCNSPTHLASDCLQKSSSRGFTPKPVSRPQVNFCRTKQKIDPPKQSNDGARMTRDRSAGAATCSNCNQVSGAGLQYESSCESSAANAVVPKCNSAVNHMQLAKETTWIGHSQGHVKPSCDDGLMINHSDTELPSDEILQDGWSCLKYIEVDVEDLSDTVIAVNNSGCQLCAVSADTIRSLDLPVFGQVKLRGISDHHLMPADVVKSRVRLTTCKRFVNITCAVVEKLNYAFILGSDIVDRLNLELMEESFVANEMMNVIHDDNDDDDVDKNEVTNDKCDNDESENNSMSDPRKASAEILRRDQKSDRSLINCWSLADRQRAGYYIRDGVLYRNYKYLGQNYEQLVLPVNRRQEVIKLAHEIYAGHLGAKTTKERIKFFHLADYCIRCAEGM